MVVGNKTDIRDATPPEDRPDQAPVLEWCRENSYGHIETSAKDGKGVHAAMSALAALALEAKRSQAADHKTGLSASSKPTLRVSELYQPSKSGACSGCS